MINNQKFNLATGGNTYNVVPLVIITNNDIVNYFSTYNLNLQELSSLKDDWKIDYINT